MNSIQASERHTRVGVIHASYSALRPVCVDWIGLACVCGLDWIGLCVWIGLDCVCVCVSSSFPKDDDSHRVTSPKKAHCPIEARLKRDDVLRLRQHTKRLHTKYKIKYIEDKILYLNSSGKVH